VGRRPQVKAKENKAKSNPALAAANKKLAGGRAQENEHQGVQVNSDLLMCA
jgi:hypothetical protein